MVENEHMPTMKQFEPPSGTRDFLAGEVMIREAAFATIRRVFERYGFEPLQTPAFERLETLTGKYGEEGDKLIFKILRRGEHEASGEADLALRYDLTVPLARVAAEYSGQLPMPYKRYAIAPVWRADRPGKGRFREFTQCDLDIVGSTSPLADAEVVSALSDTLTELGVPEFKFLLNSRQALAGLLEAYQVPEALGGGTLITLDKLDKLAPDAVIEELRGRGLPPQTAEVLVDDLTAEDSVERFRSALKESDAGRAGLEEIDQLLRLVLGQVPADRIAFTPRLVRGLEYYTGVIFEIVAPGMPGSIASGGRYDGLIARLGGQDAPACGGSLGIERILPLLGEDGTSARSADVAVPILSEDLAAEAFRLAAALRRTGMRVVTYLGSSGKLGRQLKWASDQGARFSAILGRDELDLGEVTVRDMETGEQTRIDLAEAPTWPGWRS
jgi:histidyl-tRNA synthetase